ncbi:MAG: MotA/TolQ/ExbB proton channel family protein [Negativicutes bacterium]|nr:MotA/TolQ/ExbB proton channel family protein [Negativicutes bacterium]MDR3591204.1 MotA/TolQ/ExbB proton channel family protein [Negativicutes bacterium]
MTELLKGGWMMLPLAICSLISVTVIIERWLFFRRIGKNAAAETVLELVQLGRVKDGLNLAKSSTLPLLKVLAAGMANPAEPTKAMESVGITQYSIMKKGLSTLDTIVTLAPLLGLLGTILGMMDSFHIMATVGGGGGSPHAVTGGVAEALIATATGIGVAVTTLIPYNYFTARVERESEMIEHYATQLEMALTEQE